MGEKNEKGIWERAGLRTGVTACFWLAVWQLLYMVVDKSYIVPSPASVAVLFVQLLCSPDFYKACGVTLLRVVAGLGLSFFAGVLFAFLACRFGLLKTALSGMVTVFKATPVMSVIMFALLFIVSGMIPVFVCFLMCFPVIYTNMLEALDTVPSEYRELSYVYRLSKGHFVRCIVLPWSKPFIKTGLTICAGLSWKTVVAAEVLSGPRLSMGYHLLLAKTYLEAGELFAWTAAIVSMSLLFEICLRRALKCL